MAAQVIDKLSYGATRDEEGHREYKVKWLVKSLKTDGPAMVFMASGLYSVGSYWNLGGTDAWAWCRPQMTIAIHQPREGDPSEYWTAEQTFGTKPKSKRCQDTPIEDPLLEPPKLSGSFVNAQREATVDKDGHALVTSAAETIVGPAVEFDFDNPTVCVEMNTLNLGLNTFSQMVNKVNGSPLWGLPARCVKLSNVTWDRKIWGSCCYYYTRKFDFAIDYSTTDKDGNLIGFDHWVADQGNRSVSGEWRIVSAKGDPVVMGFVLHTGVVRTTSSTVLTLPASNFDPYKGPHGEMSTTYLDGYGMPANQPIYKFHPVVGTDGYYELDFDNAAGPAAFKRLQYYREVNFLSLGIPTSL